MTNYFRLISFIIAFVVGPLMLIIGGLRYFLVKKFDRVTNILLIGGFVVMVVGYLLMVAASRGY